jgi:hypothetical protein
MEKNLAYARFFLAGYPDYLALLLLVMTKEKRGKNE